MSIVKRPSSGTQKRTSSPVPPSPGYIPPIKRSPSTESENAKSAQRKAWDKILAATASVSKSSSSVSPSRSRSNSSSRSSSRSKSPSTSSTSSEHKHRRKHKRHDSSESDTAYDPDKPFRLERWPVSPGPGLKLITRHWDPESSSDSDDDIPPPPPPPIEDCPDVQITRRISASSPPMSAIITSPQPQYSPSRPFHGLPPPGSDSPSRARSHSQTQLPVPCVPAAVLPPPSPVKIPRSLGSPASSPLNAFIAPPPPPPLELLPPALPAPSKSPVPGQTPPSLTRNNHATPLVLAIPELFIPPPPPPPESEPCVPRSPIRPPPRVLYSPPLSPLTRATMSTRPLMSPLSLSAPYSAAFGTTSPTESSSPSEPTGNLTTGSPSNPPVNISSANTSSANIPTANIPNANIPTVMSAVVNAAFSAAVSTPPSPHKSPASPSQVPVSHDTRPPPQRPPPPPSRLGSPKTEGSPRLIPTPASPTNGPSSISELRAAALALTRKLDLAVTKKDTPPSPPTPK